MDNERLNYLDMARGVAIIFVVIGHIIPACDFKIAITSFHVPLFFIVSGSLIRYKNKKEINIFNSFKRLIIPCILFSVLNLVAWLFLTGASYLNVKGLLFSCLSGLGIGALWFLPAIFLSENLFIFINSKIKKILMKYALIILLTTIAFIVVPVQFDNVILDSLKLLITRSIFGTLFISVGYVAFEKIKTTNCKWYILILLGFGCISLAIYNNQVDLYSLTFNNKFLYLLNSIMLSLITIIVLKVYCRKIKFLYYCGINSLAIMATHQIVMMLISKFTKSEFKTYPMAGVLFVSVMISELLIVKVINSYMPIMVGKYKDKLKTEKLSA